MKRIIHIFNPETDYALAYGKGCYSPTAGVVCMRKRLALTPARYANPEDVIVLMDDFSESELRSQDLYPLLSGRNLIIAGIEEIMSIIRTGKPEDFMILPWGWNHTLRNNLLRHDIDPCFIKSIDEIDTIRRLSHRRTVIPFQRLLAVLIPDMDIKTACEFKTSDEAMDFYKEHHDVFFKMPWSSSGRGVIDARLTSERELRRWIAGSIRHQGSVMGEMAFQRTGDFASEWWCTGGHAHFLGLSLFRIAGSGRYIGNAILPQGEIAREISRLSPAWDTQIIEAQKTALETIIAPEYSGPAGIDMLSTADGGINPCVEINMRMTMGLAALWETAGMNIPQ